MQTTILHHYVHRRRAADQVATWAGLELCRMIPGVEVEDRRSGDDYSWAEALEALWDLPGDLVNVDMDIAIHPDHLVSFDRCPHEACTFAYYIDGGGEGARRPELVHRAYIDGELLALTEGAEWADFIGEGLMRIREPLRASILPTPRVPHVSYRDQDGELCRRLGVRWHVHWPAVVHHHGWL